MAILVPRWLDFNCRVRLQMCPKVSMGVSFLYGQFLERENVTYRSNFVYEPSLKFWIQDRHVPLLNFVQVLPTSRYDINVMMYDNYRRSTRAQL